MNSEVNGLNRLAYAERYGHVLTTESEQFIQIINVRKTHWIAPSNLQSNMGEVFIYDSLINLNVKGDKISFPIRVEQTTCQLLRTNLDFIDMRVVDVQQQRGGRDCGLFTIVFAVALCLGKDPIQGVIKQTMLRKALTDCFEQRDISTLLDAVSFKPNPSNTNMISLSVGM